MVRNFLSPLNTSDGFCLQLTSLSIHCLSMRLVPNSYELAYIFNWNTRINHECEGRIDKSITRITDWHHKACRAITNGDPEGQIFLSYHLTNNTFFFSLTTVFFKF